MVDIKVCIGSSCYLKNVPQLVDMFNKKIEENNLKDEIKLAGSFCAGRCNRIGVTVTVNGEIHTGVTIETFNQFWNEVVAPLL